MKPVYITQPAIWNAPGTKTYEFKKTDVGSLLQVPDKCAEDLIAAGRAISKETALESGAIDSPPPAFEDLEEKFSPRELLGEAPQAPAAAKPAEKAVKKEDSKPGICRGFFKNGKPCTHKALKNGFCRRHQGQAAQAAQAGQAGQ